MMQHVVAGRASLAPAAAPVSRAQGSSRRRGTRRVAPSAAAGPPPPREQEAGSGRAREAAGRAFAGALSLLMAGAYTRSLLSST